MEPNQNVEIEIEDSPVYELVISLFIYLSKKDKNILELGKSWYKQVDHQLTSELNQKIKEDRIFKNLGVDLLYVYKSPNKHSIAEFLNGWKLLKDEEMEDLYLSVLRQMNNKESVKKFKKTYTYRWIEEQGYGALRDYLHGLWLEWHEEYFCKIQDKIASVLKQDALEKNKLAHIMNPVQLIEKATNGILLEDEQVKKVVLIPQYHSNPYNITQNLSDTLIFFYPVDFIEESSDMPSRKLMRLTKCVADETRLKILKFVNEGEKSFMDIVKQTNLAKSTVHHHLVVLRAAGLIRLHQLSKDGVRYSFRESRIKDVSSLISDYIK